MRHQDYEAVIHYDDEDRLLYGRVLGLREIIGFHGDSVVALEQAFGEAVDDYLADCTERGVEPAKPFSGKFVARVPPELHRRLAAQAEQAGISLNTLVVNKLSAPPGDRVLEHDETT